jgi:hypothetical protein
MEIGTDAEIDKRKGISSTLKNSPLKRSKNSLRLRDRFTKTTRKSVTGNGTQMWKMREEGRESEEKMNALETACIEREYLLGGYGAERGCA